MNINQTNDKKTYKVGIVGAGLMGTGLAQMLSTSEVIEQVFWCSGHERDITKQREDLLKFIDRQVRKGKLPDNAYDMATSKLIIIDSFQALVDCDFIHEVIIENIEIKHKVLMRLSDLQTKKSIIATNTSSVSITELAKSNAFPERFIGMHFFNPVNIMKLVEIVSGYYTNIETKEESISYAIALGKTPVEVFDSPGFIVNRMIIPMINEAICILAENISDRNSIDNAMKLGVNHPIGPLALSDLIGNDVVLSILDVLHNETGDQKYRPHPYLKKLVRAGRLGKKTKAGFYDY
jgi:3-hydroxybutyryl-CoA dehydrogenase